MKVSEFGPIALFRLAQMKKKRQENFRENFLSSFSKKQKKSVSSRQPTLLNFE